MDWVADLYAKQYERADWRRRWSEFDPDDRDLHVDAVTRSDSQTLAGDRHSTGNPLPPKYADDGGNGSVGATVRNPGGGVLGFAIAFLAFAFGGALGLPESVRLLVIGAGVLLAVLSAGLRGFGLAALVLGGVVLLSSITLLGALGVGRVLKVSPSHPTPPTTPPPQQDGGYILTLYDKEFAEAWWSLASTAEHRTLCASVGDGVVNAEIKHWVHGVESEGFPVREGEDWKGRARALLEYMGITYC